MSFSDFINRVDARKVNKKVLESLIKVGALGTFGKRTALLSSMDVIKSKLSKPKENNGQSGLFSLEEEEKISAFVSDDSVIDNSIEDFGDEERENFERDLLGFSISAKPLNELLDPLETDITCKIFELNPEEQKDKIVKIGAVIREVRVITTKKNNSEMAFVKAEDTTGIVDLVVFPKIYQEVRNFLKDGKVAFISGRVDRREEEISFLVETMEESKGNKGHIIHIPAGTSKEKLLNLKKMFEENRGEDEVTLVFDENNKKVTPQQRIKWSKPFQVEISKIF